MYVDFIQSSERGEKIATVLFINLYNAFPSLSPLFSASIFWVCQIRHTVLTIGIDRILICGVFASDSILILNKVLSFHNKEHTFFY